MMKESAAGAGRFVDAAPIDNAIRLDTDRDTPLTCKQIEALCRQGFLSARLTGSRLNTPPRPFQADLFLGWIACLRDMTACGVPVSWQAGPGLADLRHRLIHIAPPEVEESPAFEEWRRGHRFGTCYWRAGPQFVAIVDRRDEVRAHHYILDTADYLEVFSKAHSVVARRELLAIDADAAKTLEDEGLILSLGGWSLALPFRMRHWPVPFSAI